MPVFESLGTTDVLSIDRSIGFVVSWGFEAGGAALFGATAMAKKKEYK